MKGFSTMSYFDHKIILEFTAYLKNRPLREGILVTCSCSFFDENSGPQDFRIHLEKNCQSEESEDDKIIEVLEDLNITDVNEVKQDEFVASWYEYWASIGEKQVLDEWASVLENHFTECTITSVDTEFINGQFETHEASELSTEELWIKHQQEVYRREFLLFTEAWKANMGKKSTKIKLKRPRKKKPKYRGVQSVINIRKEAKLLGFQYSEDNNDIESVSLSTYDESHIENIHASTILSNKVVELVENEVASENGLCLICNSSGSSCCSISGQPGMKKYWEQRYRLFSKFDLGIQLDLESWFSVTAEKIAQHHAKRCACDVIIDAFCGAGGNTIQFAQTCNRVIAIDIDPVKISMARHNAAIYNVDDKIEFIVGDFTHLYSVLRADVVFLSPPWGGPSYIQAEVYDVNRSLTFNNQNVYELAKSVSPNVAIYLPRNSDLNQILQLCEGGDSVEVEQNFLSRRLKSLTAYFGSLIHCDDQ